MKKIESILKVQSPASKRIIFIDALRGFTMIFIIGGEFFLVVFIGFGQIRLRRHWPKYGTCRMGRFLFYGFDFPLFLFLVGLILPTIILRRLEKGETPQQLYPHIIKRTLVLIFLGLVNYGLLKFDWNTMRWSSVLGRIGICYFLASLIVIHTNWRVQASIVFVILIGY